MASSNQVSTDLLNFVIGFCQKKAAIAKLTNPNAVALTTKSRPSGECQGMRYVKMANPMNRVNRRISWVSVWSDVDSSMVFFVGFKRKNAKRGSLAFFIK